jgi:hypothetical protein
LEGVDTSASAIDECSCLFSLLLFFYAVGRVGVSYVCLRRSIRAPSSRDLCELFFSRFLSLCTSPLHCLAAPRFCAFCRSVDSTALYVFSCIQKSVRVHVQRKVLVFVWWQPWYCFLLHMTETNKEVNETKKDTSVQGYATFQLLYQLAIGVGEGDSYLIAPLILGRV